MKRILSLLLVLAMLAPLAACAGTPSVTTAVTAAPDAPDIPDADKYNSITKEDYRDKVTAGYLAQVVAFLTDYKFVWNANGTPRVALPDEWFGICKGSDTPNNPYHQKVNKLFQNADTGLWEVYIADTFGIDIIDQYVLRDMFEQYGGITTKVISEDWVKFGVWDMGGGQRSVGAYPLAKKGYISPFTGMAEYGNRYPWAEEPWIENDALSMVCAGMPDLAVSLSRIFGSYTGDSDNLIWLDFIAAMYAMAFFEDDIPTLIRTAAELFPDDSWEKQVVDTVFELYAKYPDNWRAAVVRAEQSCMRRGYYYYNGRSQNVQSRVDVNMAFGLLGLLYGEGDYEKSCVVFSLSGYDARGVVFLPIIGIISGMASLPEEANKYTWQDGEGVIVNLPVVDETQKGLWMHSDNLQERWKITEIIDLYVENFEKILVANGGVIENDTYYIPKSEFHVYDTVKIENYNFEAGDLSGYTVLGGTVKLTDTAYFGQGAVEVTAKANVESGVANTVSGLTVGATYRLTAYVIASKNATAMLFARNVDGTKESTASVVFQSEYVKRELVFTATAETMNIGFRVDAADDVSYGICDHLTLIRIDETVPEGVTATLGDGRVDISGKAEGEVYLRLTFKNTASVIIDGTVTVSGVDYGVIPFYKTGTATAGTDVVYIPIRLKNGGKTNVRFAFSAKGVTLLSAAVVTVNDRLVLTDYQ